MTEDNIKPLPVRFVIYLGKAARGDFGESYTRRPQKVNDIIRRGFPVSFQLGAMALAFPQILGSGHGGIMRVLHSGFDLAFLAGLLVGKIAASAVSIGSGFRGGLFSTSLFLGALFGSSEAEPRMPFSSKNPMT